MWNEFIDLYRQQLTLWVSEDRIMFQFGFVCLSVLYFSHAFMKLHSTTNRTKEQIYIKFFTFLWLADEWGKQISNSRAHWVPLSNQNVMSTWNPNLHFYQKIECIRNLQAYRLSFTSSEESPKCHPPGPKWASQPLIYSGC